MFPGKGCLLVTATTCFVSMILHNYQRLKSLLYLNQHQKGELCGNEETDKVARSQCPASLQGVKTELSEHLVSKGRDEAAGIMTRARGYSKQTGSFKEKKSCLEDKNSIREIRRKFSIRKTKK